jgi:hypothetical protein
MKNILSRRIVILGILCLLTLLAAGPGGLSAQTSRSIGGECGQGYCYEGSYCDDCLCYHPDTFISQSNCGWATPN